MIGRFSRHYGTALVKVGPKRAVEVAICAFDSAKVIGENILCAVDAAPNDIAFAEPDRGGVITVQGGPYDGVNVEARADEDATAIAARLLAAMRRREQERAEPAMANVGSSR